jgi:hypothetical protein
MSEEKKTLGKVIYRPPEKCYSNVYIVETSHGYKVYRTLKDVRPMAFIPHSAVKNIEYRSER